MRKNNVVLAAALLLLAAAAHAAPAQAVNLDGSGASGKKPKPSATAASPSAPIGVKAEADADMASRDARAAGPRLQVKRQNLKDNEAARATRQQATPNEIDRATAYGDIDHTEQPTNLLVKPKK